MTRHLVVAVALGALLLLTRGAAAHGSRVAYLDVVETAHGEAVASLRSGAISNLSIASSDCAVEAIPDGARSQSVMVSRLRCPRGVTGAELEIKNLAQSDDVVIARVMLENGTAHGAVLTRRSPQLAIPGGGRVDSVLSRYVRLGIEHVLSGLDHILFLLALTWQAHRSSGGRLRPWASALARDVTGFTLAHTVTLTSTALGWIRVEPALAETLIALSLVLIALDTTKEDRTRSRFGLVMAFGLVHGLGFAGALAGARLPEHAAALGLLAFNVGVEIGQLTAIGSAVLLSVLFARIVPANRVTRGYAATLSAYVVGVTGAYLVFARASTLFLR